MRKLVGLQFRFAYKKASKNKATNALVTPQMLHGGGWLDGICIRG
jgi:hypothetical protein